LRQPYTLGVEEEYQLIDASTGELTDLPQDGTSNPIDLGDGVTLKREFHTCAVEVDSDICTDVGQVRIRLAHSRRALNAWCQERGQAFIAAGTHPYSDWKQTNITDAGRYLELVDTLQDVGRGNLVFGLHVHVAVPDRERAVHILSRARAHLPHLLALSCSSPFWLGRETGMMSSRTAVFSRIPRTGIPPKFESKAAYRAYVTQLERTGCIEDATRIWWDLRLHGKFPTLEFRVCDMMPRLDDAMALVGLTQAIVATLDRLLDEDRAPEPLRRALVEENKWRAARFGMRGPLCDFDHELERQPDEFIEDLLSYVDEALDELGSREVVEPGLRRILAEGTSSERQLAVHQKSAGDMSAVLDSLRAETLEGLGEGAE